MSLYAAFIQRWREMTPERQRSWLDAFVREQRDDIAYELRLIEKRLESHHPTLLSMFDFTGNWARPFEKLGWDVVQVDLKLGQDIRTWSARSMLREILEAFPTIDGVIAAPPCTDFAYSGAAHWADKDADGRTDASVHLVYQVLRAVDFLKPGFWALENPAGRIQKLVPELGEPAFIFDPCDFAGWTTSAADHIVLDQIRDRESPRCSAGELTVVKRTGAYTKRTLLWGKFRAPQANRIEPVRCTAQGSWLQALGGTSERTKAERSITPEGFALAFAAAQAGLSNHLLEEFAAEVLRERETAESQAPRQLDFLEGSP